jgi:O-acetyl-ADP-ribose deacetylase (regulator of RNase III)
MNAGRDAELLANCYTSSLRAAADHACRSIAFPSISTGAYGYPIDEASRIALAAIRDYVQANPSVFDLIEVVTFSASDERIYQRAYNELFAPAALRAGRA